MGIDHLRALNNTNVKASLNTIYTHTLDLVDTVSMFWMFLPRELLKNPILVDMNKNLQRGKLDVVSFGDFLQGIGVLILCPQCLVSINLLLDQKSNRDIYGGSISLPRLDVFMVLGGHNQENCLHRKQSTLIQGSFIVSTIFIDRWKNSMAKIFNL